MVKEEKPTQKTRENEKIVARGRLFEGSVTKKFPKRVVIEFERTVFIPKYERFSRKRTKLHARLPDSFSTSINVGDYIQIQECRPLSKIINFIVIKKIRSGDSNTNTEEKK